MDVQVSIVVFYRKKIQSIEFVMFQNYWNFQVERLKKMKHL